MTPRGELAVSTWKSSPFRRRRSASSTSGWSSAMRMRGVAVDTESERREVGVGIVVPLATPTPDSGRRDEGIVAELDIPDQLGIQQLREAFGGGRLAVHRLGALVLEHEDEPE